MEFSRDSNYSKYLEIHTNQAEHQTEHLVT